MSGSSVAGAGGLLEFEIRVAGNLIPETVRIVSMEILAGLNTGSSAKLVVIDGDSPDQNWPVLDSEIFGLGNEIQIDAGYDARTELVFEGVIIKQSSRISADSYSRLIYECQNRAKATTPEWIDSQAGNTDPVLDITYGENLLAFSAEYDPELSPFVLNRDYYPDLKNFKYESTRTKGSMRFSGFAGVVPGVTINLAGVGKRFEGIVFVNAVRHEIKEGNWHIEVEFWKPDRLV